MAKILNLIVQDRSDPRDTVEFVTSFTIREDIQQPGQALRAAVSEFVSSGTAEAKEALDYANGYFNWGDAITRIPDSLFIKNGLTPLKQDAVDIFVDHNEVLNYDDADNPDLAEIRKRIKEFLSDGEKDISYWARGENLMAEGMTEEITERNNKLKSLLAMDTITEDTMNELIADETDDSLVVIYESILEEIQSNQIE
jgi:hypothetical protein